MPQPSSRDIAREIAQQLFVDGFGGKARRLVMEYEGGPDVPGSGWCLGAVADRITAAIDAAVAEEREGCLKAVEFDPLMAKADWENSDDIAHAVQAMYLSRIRARGASRE